MTDEEFFNKVKYKKITWCGWEKDHYFIPDKLYGDALIQGVDSIYGIMVNYKIYDGFKPFNWFFF